MKPLSGKSLAKRKTERDSVMATIVKRREEQLAMQGSPAPSRPNKRLPNTTQAKQEAAKPTREELDQPYRAIRNLKLALIEYQSEHIANVKTLAMIQQNATNLADRPTSDFERARGAVIRADTRRLTAEIVKLDSKMRAQRNDALSNGRTKGTKNNKGKAAKGEAALKAAINKLTSSGVKKYGTAAGIADTINKKPNEYFPPELFPGGPPYVLTTIYRKVKEILKAHRKAAQ